MQRALVFVVLAVCQWAPWMLAGPVGPAVGAVAGTVLFAIALWWAVRRTAPAQRSSWGLSPANSARRMLVTGLLGGALTYLAVFGVRWWLGAGEATLDVRLEDVLPILLTGLAVAGYQAFSEEVVFRGAVFTLLPPQISVPSAIAISTSLFVLFHLPKWESLVNGPYALHLVLAGVAFAIAYVRTGALWLGMGLHAGWNAGAYLLREGDPALLRLTASLPEGWDGWSSWVAVAGNAVMLLLTLALTSKRISRPAVEPGIPESAILLR
jgi:membrane protease YdiL (CAAX protease family)